MRVAKDVLIEQEVRVKQVPIEGVPTEETLEDRGSSDRMSSGPRTDVDGIVMWV